MSRAKALFALLFLWPALAPAQSSSVPLSHWQHSAWVGDRAPPLPVQHSMLRSPDGYLWLGSERGLVRFDGERFTLIDSSYSPLFPHRFPEAYEPVLVDQGGRMWVTGPTNILLSYDSGVFRQVLRDSGQVHGVAEDGSGRIWLAVDTRLRLLRDGRLETPILPRDVPDTGVMSLITDNEGGFWFGTLADGLWHVRGAVAEHFATGKLWPLLQASDGTLWFTGDRGAYRGITLLKNGVFTAVLRPDRPEVVTGGGAVEGPDGSVWIPSFSAGLLRWRHGAVEQFTARDGLSSNTTKGVVVSAEGAVWVSTDAGLDRLRPAAFVPAELRDGVPDEAPASYAVATDGSLWAALRTSGLFRFDSGIVRRRPGPVIAQRHALAVDSATLQDVLAASSKGGIWIAPNPRGEVLYYRDGRVQQRYGAKDGLPPERPWSATEARDGTLWLKFFPRGFGRIRNGQFRSISVPVGTGPDNMAVGADGNLWLAAPTRKTMFLMVGDSVIREFPLPKDDWLLSLVAERGDTLWGAAQRSLYRFIDGHFTEVHIPAIAGILETVPRLAIAHDQLWVASEGGLAALPLSELHGLADGEQVAPVVRFFDQLDGIGTPRSKGTTRKSLQVGPDGRLWIATPTGFVVTDDSPRQINRVPPMIHLEEVTLDDKRIAVDPGGSIRPNPGRLGFRFSAPSLGLPERIRVEYRLVGSDNNWIESKPPRLANYDHLRPGRYQFEARAWNEAGTPSNTNVSLMFTVLPAWYQSNWFLTACIVTIALLGAFIAHLLSRARHRRAAAAVETRYEAVLTERTRLARELHDTLLQGFTGLTLQIDGVRSALQERNQEQSAVLSSILERADRTLRDAREMVWDIRKAAPDDLGKALQAEGEALANPDNVALEYLVLGAPRSLAPTVVTTLLRIAREAMANALNHARATRIVVKLAYEGESVELEVQDDGCGADLKAIETASARGHWGVAGMRERARSVGAALSVSAEPGKGTRVGVQVMAPPDRRREQSE